MVTKENSDTPQITSTILLWTARITGTVVLLFLLVFVGAHLFEETSDGGGFRSTTEVLTFLCFPVSTMLGLLLALKWEGLGGSIVLFGMLCLFLLRSDLLSSPYMYASVLPGCLYCIYWIKSKR